MAEHLSTVYMSPEELTTNWESSEIVNFLERGSIDSIGVIPVEI